MLPATVSADDFGIGPPTAGWYADSVIHTYCFSSSFNSDLENNADYAMQTSLQADTDIQYQFQTCATTTDVWWWDANLPGTTRGLHKCQVKSNPTTCDASYVTLDPAQINIGSDDEEDTHKTACHEAGHSVGLEHGGSIDCMLNGEIPNTLVQFRRYSGHHIWHIDVNY